MVHIAYLDELLGLQDALEKAAAEEYEGPKVRHEAGVAAAGGIGAGAGAVGQELGREGLRRRIGALERQRRGLQKSIQGAWGNLPSDVRAQRLGKLKNVEKSIEATQKALRGKLGKGGGRWKGPLIGASMAVPAATAAMGAATPKGREAAGKAWRKAKKYV
jgi:hypothetical protein